MPAASIDLEKARNAVLAACPVRSIDATQHLREREATPTRLKVDPPRDARAICAPRATGNLLTF